LQRVAYSELVLAYVAFLILLVPLPFISKLELFSESEFDVACSLMRSCKNIFFQKRSEQFFGFLNIIFVNMEPYSLPRFLFI